VLQKSENGLDNHVSVAYFSEGLREFLDQVKEDYCEHEIEDYHECYSNNQGSLGIGFGGRC